MKVNNRSDFRVSLKLLDLNTQAALCFPETFEIELSTKGTFKKYYTHNDPNVSIDSDKKEIVVAVNVSRDNYFPNGKLVAKLRLNEENTAFEDGFCNTTHLADLDIEIWDGNTEQGDAIASDTFQGTVTLGGLYTESVKFSAQELKEPQQVQARENIKAVGVDEFTSKLNGIEAILDSIITTQESI